MSGPSARSEQHVPAARSPRPPRSPRPSSRLRRRRAVGDRHGVAGASGHRRGGRRCRVGRAGHRRGRWSSWWWSWWSRRPVADAGDVRVGAGAGGEVCRGPLHRLEVDREQVGRGELGGARRSGPSRAGRRGRPGRRSPVAGSKRDVVAAPGVPPRTPTATPTPAAPSTRIGERARATRRPVEAAGPHVAAAASTARRVVVGVADRRRRPRRSRRRRASIALGVGRAVVATSSTSTHDHRDVVLAPGVVGGVDEPVAAAAGSRSSRRMRRDVAVDAAWT